jgi:ABC-type uncharacterized transport system permease subunit
LFLIISWLIFAVYGAACVFYWRGFFHDRHKDHQWAQVFFVTALIGHLAFIIYFIVHLGRVPVATVSETLGTFVWLTACIYWILEKRLKNHSMSAFILTILAVILAVGNATFSEKDRIAEILQDIKFELHVLTLLVAYGAFAISFIASLLHTFLNREIQKRRFRVFYSRLPSLPFFERISNAAIDIGLVFATIGMAIGLRYALDIWEGFFFSSDPKFIAAFVTWLIYCAHFLGRRFAGWGVQRTATVSIIGFSWLLFSFLVISMLFTSLHDFTGG